ncbi:ABC transporter substrate-binding protein [Roseateles sp. SL47]|uniref:ABC transporter substrate-binding protein n=1 Tax=Roseateles sp. SL47 TaxID=2995138 RepID=UPI0022714B8F|nr:ABC transporter substrate-binding protein [Roseateles sp. SL47]WAC74203.1 ABC transporter substrate-binding protein [Roseateles sp. SL47]
MQRMTASTRGLATALIFGFSSTFAQVPPVVPVAQVEPMGAASSVSGAPVAVAGPEKVLRVAMRVAETGFDPAYVTDLYSRNLVANMFDAPLRYSYLQRPYQLEPSVTDGMPEVLDNATRFIFRIKPGIYFSDDPAFKGKKRELTGADLIYTLKRHYDPVVKSGHLYRLQGAGILGLDEVRNAALKGGKPFNYDQAVEGLRLVDRYTVDIRVRNSDPRFIYHFADPMLSLMAREVVETYGDRVGEHPVGTNAWVLSQWRRSSQIVFTRNPNFREVYYHEPVPTERPVLAEQVKRLQGRRLPMVDRVEISVIEESQPRWLSYLRKEFDLLDDLPNEFAPVAIPQNKLAPNLAKQGQRAIRYERADVTMSYFNMEDPVVGGYTPDKIALRRAIALAVNQDEQIRLPRRGQAVPAQGIISPGVFGYDKQLKSEMGEFDRARAKALLDLYGYVDKDGDGWRDLPDGSPLTLEYTTEPDARKRQLAELWQKNMTAIGVRMRFKIGKWPENLKAANAGRLQMWGLSWGADIPDGENFLGLAYGPSKGQSNKSRFDLPEYNRLFEQQHSMPDGPERLALMQKMQRMAVAYMPFKAETHQVFTDLAHPWVIGYDKNLYQRDYWAYVDIDTDVLQKSQRH